MKVSREMNKYSELSEIQKCKTKMFRRKYKRLWARQKVLKYNPKYTSQKKIIDKSSLFFLFFFHHIPFNMHRKFGTKSIQQWKLASYLENHEVRNAAAASFFFLIL